MIFRLSQKLTRRLKAGTVHGLPLDENPFADWSAHLFRADRTQYVIVSHTKSLYSTLMFAKGITSDNQFITRAVGGIREMMEDDGQISVYQQFIAPASGAVRFGSAFSRSVTGSLNELVFHAMIWLTEGELAPHDVGLKLNDIPFSILSYATPRECFLSLRAGPLLDPKCPAPRKCPPLDDIESRPVNLPPSWYQSKR